MKLMNNMSIDTLMHIYEQQDFDDFQLNEIRVGLDRGVNVSLYADRVYHWGQMQMIRNGLERNLDVSKYADPRVSLNDMILMYQKLCKQKGVPTK
jgi:hypothetical protein